MIPFGILILVFEGSLAAIDGALDGFFQLDAVDLHISATGKADDATHASYSDDTEQLVLTRVRLFELDYRIRQQFQDLHGGFSFRDIPKTSISYFL